jgi:hypothetical protein
MRRLLPKIGLSLLCVAAIAFLFPAGDIAAQIAAVRPSSLFLPFALIFFGIVVSSFRFHQLAERFSVELPFKTAHYINVMSQVAGLLFFQLVGQMAFRSSVGSRYVANAQRMALLTILEKAAAVGSVLIIALIGAYTITRSINIDTHAVGPLGVVMGTLVLCVFFVYRFSLTSGQRRYLRRLGRLLQRVRLDKTIAASIAIHLLTLGAYVAIARWFLPQASLPTLAGAFAVVMFGAAIPISFAGWGARELSAGFVFSMLSFDPAVGITVAALVGVLSLACLAAHGVISNFLSPKTEPQHMRVVSGPAKIHIERAIAFVAAGIIAVLIGAQIRFGSAASELTVNLADPAALVAALTFLTIWYVQYRDQRIWHVRGLKVALLAFVVMIAVGWAVGYFRYGSNSWASINRLSGLMILLSYCLAGAMFVGFFGRDRIALLLKASLLTSVVVFGCYFALTGFDVLPRSIAIALSWSGSQFSGLAANRNAVAFQLLIVLSILLALPPSSMLRRRELAVAVAVFLILATGSRAGMLAGSATIALAVILGVFGRAQLFRAGAMVGVLCVIQLAITKSNFAVFGTSGPSLFGGLNSNTIAVLQIDRIASFVEGSSMWFDHMILGAGLGAFLEVQTQTGPAPLVIHNSLLWIAAEMGLVGLVLFLILPVVLTAHSLRNGLRNLAWQDAALLLCLAGAFVFSQFHEILYQRILWFAIGLLAAQKLVLVPTKLSGVVAPSLPEMEEESSGTEDERLAA